MRFPSCRRQLPPSLPLCCLALALACLGAFDCAHTAAQAPAGPSAAAPAKPGGNFTCNVIRAQPTEGESALAREDYAAALAFYNDAVAKQTDSLEADYVEAHYGLVRALLGSDRLAEASREADALLAAHPSSALAEVATAAVAYRMADFNGTLQHLRKATALDRCEGREHAMAAELYDAMGYHAIETSRLDLAHRLRPNDEEILRAWIDSLPRQRRQVELAKYLAGRTSLSDRDHAILVAQEDHLQAHKEGECHIAAKGDITKVPFVPIMGETNHTIAYGLNVAFNGKSRHLQIDTGASGITLSAGVAKRLGLAPEYHLHTSGVGDEGAVGSYLTHVESIQIGDVTLSNCMVDVLEKPKGGERLDVDGLIGLDVFGHWLATLDYPNRQLVLKPLPPRPDAPSTTGAEEEEAQPHDPYIAPEMKDWMSVLRIGHNILLPTLINTGKLHYTIADTGASQSVLSLALARESGKAHKDDSITFTGVSGKVKEVYRLDDAKLQFGHLMLPPGSFFAFDLTRLSHDVGTEISGFVGLETLSRLTITVDYRDNLILMQFDPKHDPAFYVGRY